MSTISLLSTADYLVIAVGCVLSVTIGLYFSLTKKQNNSFEYFLASRSINSIFIILSYYATVSTGSALISTPNEIYLFGTQMMLGRVTNIFCVFIANAIFLPIIHQLNSPSIYKYLELRYNSLTARVVIFLNILQQLGHASVHLFAIAISLSSVTPLSMWTLVGIISVFVITYSTFGGMRGIILADSFQAIIMISVIFAVLIRSIMVCAGISTVWQRNFDGGRLELFNFDTDLRTRYTVWTELALFVSALHGNTIHQTLQQRVLSAPTVTQAKKVAVCGVILSVTMMLFLNVLGLFMYSYFYLCDPVKSGTLKSVNQIASYYVGEIFHNIPGMAGFYFAGVSCAFLSTYSSVLNSFAAVFVDGIVQPLLPKINNENITKISKVTVVLFGLLTIGGVQLAGKFPTITQASSYFASICNGPVLFIFLIGVFCPQANSKIVLCSFVSTFAVMIWMLCGATLVRSPTVTKPISIAGCAQFANASFNHGFRNFTLRSGKPRSFSYSLASYFPLSAISFRWFALFGFLVILILFALLNLIFYRVLPPLSTANHALIPDIVKRWHLKLDRRWRRIFLCDVYGQKDREQDLEAETKLTGEVPAIDR